ncbi:MAG: DUF2252 family protein [Bacteroidetes bacterium]|nr:DUF2252 family protein [Bacteroidota bacterium]
MHSTTSSIIEANSSRLPQMTRVKYSVMQENPFRFFRGSCHLFYEELAREEGFPGGPCTWISGDLHLENFGSFRADNDLVYFDLNDFDEAVLGPVTWEAARLAASIYIGFDSLEIESKRAEKMAQLFIRSYSATLCRGKADYIEQATARGIVRDFLDKVTRRRQKRILRRRTTLGSKRVQMLLANPKHLKLGREQKQELMEFIGQWLKTDEYSPYNYTVEDAIFRLAGTGSLGLERYAFLLKSANKAGPKYLLLDMKEAVSSCLVPLVPCKQPDWGSEAERVVTLQKRMQNRYPALLSHTVFRGKTFVMQEMQPVKDNIKFTLLKDRYRDMYSVIDSMAVLTASSHIRSGGQDGSCTTDELRSFGRRDNWQQSVIEYARRYATRNKEYFQRFREDMAGQAHSVDAGVFQFV